MFCPHFKTKDQLAHFVTHSTNPTHSSDTGSGLELPFTLMTVRSEGQFNSIIYAEKDRFRSVIDRATVPMNARDISELGLKEGDPVQVRSESGTILSLATRAFDLPQG